MKAEQSAFIEFCFKNSISRAKRNLFSNPKRTARDFQSLFCDETLATLLSAGCNDASAAASTHSCTPATATSAFQFGRFVCGIHICAVSLLNEILKTRMQSFWANLSTPFFCEFNFFSTNFIKCKLSRL